MIVERIRHGMRLRHRCMFGLVVALLSMLALSTGAVAQAVRVAEDVREYKVPASPPEGVVYDQKTQAFYGGSVSDGLIYKGTLDDPTAEVFLPPGSDGRNEAIGVNVDNEGRLYIAGGSSGTLYVVNNQDELIVEVLLSGDYLGGQVVGNTTTPKFHTPTTASLAGSRLLVANAEFFDQSEPGPPFYVVSIPRP